MYVEQTYSNSCHTWSNQFQLRNIFTLFHSFVDSSTIHIRKRSFISVFLQSHNNSQQSATIMIWKIAAHTRKRALRKFRKLLFFSPPRSSSVCVCVCNLIKTHAAKLRCFQANGSLSTYKLIMHSWKWNGMRGAKKGYIFMLYTNIILFISLSVSPHECTKLAWTDERLIEF